MKPFTILIPVFNEEDILEDNTAKLMKFLDGMKTKYEVLVCSNGSTDRTDDIGKRLEKKYRNLRFFCINKKGVGLAFQNNVMHAKNEFLISLDIDFSIDMDFIPRCASLLEKYDIVSGSKKIGNQNRSKIRELLSRVYIFLSMQLFGLEYSDYSIAAKGYRKSSIKKYIDRIDYGSSYVLEIIFYTKENGGKITEIPVNCNDRRKSKFNIVHEVFYRFKNLTIFWLRKKLSVV